MGYSLEQLKSAAIIGFREGISPPLLEKTSFGEIRNTFGDDTNLTGIGIARHHLMDTFNPGNIPHVMTEVRRHLRLFQESTEKNINDEMMSRKSTPIERIERGIVGFITAIIPHLISNTRTAINDYVLLKEKRKK